MADFLVDLSSLQRKKTSTDINNFFELFRDNFNLKINYSNINHQSKVSYLQLESINR